jgi:beta-lactam-binding protein with PASTA domain
MEIALAVIALAVAVVALVVALTREPSAKKTAVAPRSTTSLPLVAVPDVIGDQRAPALRAMNDAGLTAHFTLRYRLMGFPIGHVAGQSPVPSSMVRRGTKVTLALSA